MGMGILSIPSPRNLDREAGGDPPRRASIDLIRRPICAVEPEGTGSDGATLEYGRLRSRGFGKVAYGICVSVDAPGM